MLYLLTLHLIAGIADSYGCYSACWTCDCCL